MRRAVGELPTRASEIYVADTLGELGTLYKLATVAFVGGSLVDRGGHNPIEAVRHGAVVVTGPYWQNFKDTYEALLESRGAIAVHSAGELAGAVEPLPRTRASLTSTQPTAGFGAVS